MAAINMISELKPYRTNWKIKAKILRLWKQESPYGATLELILADSMVSINYVEEGENDEIRDYYDCRYVSTCEATWRILAYPIHRRTTAVQKLIYHLENEQLVMFDEEDDIDEVLNRESVYQTMFLAWMECNRRYPHARDLLYAEFPNHFVWNQKTKQWTPRQKGFSGGRVNHVPLKFKEFFYMRILLNRVRGPRSYEELRTVNGIVHPTFRDACYALGLMDDDNEYIEAIKEASFWGTGLHLHRLFAVMLLSESISKPKVVWEETWDILSEDILSRRRRMLRTPGLRLDEEQLKKFTLVEIKKILKRNGTSLANYPDMPLPKGNHSEETLNRLIINEESYNCEKLAKFLKDNLGKLTDEQGAVYNEILDAVVNDKGSIFFVSGFGGTGKTSLSQLLSAH